MEPYCSWFQSTPHLGATAYQVAQQQAIRIVSIHAPARGRRRLLRFADRVRVSIHAPRLGGAPRCAENLKTTTQCFHPRLPRGWGQGHRTRYSCYFRFQSTPPA
jgi:hypothetical protein